MPHRFTDEQREFISSNVSGRNRKELTELFNAQFDLNLKHSQIVTFLKNNGLRCGIDARFQSGHVPANKGTKGLYNVGGNQTSFKKGQKAINYKPVGYERVDKDGYMLTKVQNDGPWHKRWKHKHKVIWEQHHHRAVPKGHAIIFGDGDKRNFEIENLVLVTRAQLAILNKHGLIRDNTEMTKSGVIIADIIMKISERKRKRK